MIKLIESKMKLLLKAEKSFSLFFCGQDRERFTMCFTKSASLCFELCHGIPSLTVCVGF